jgi:hypothetical protein
LLEIAQVARNENGVVFEHRRGDAQVHLTHLKFKFLQLLTTMNGCFVEIYNLDMGEKANCGVALSAGALARTRPITFGFPS